LYTNFDKKKKPKSRLSSSFKRASATELDTGLLLVLFLFFGLGLVQVYSSSFIFATETHSGDGLFFIKRQLIFTALSIFAFCFFAFVPWRLIKPIGAFAWCISLFGISLALHPAFGHEAGGAARWINLGLFKFEPSELLKISLPLIMALILTTRFHEERLWDFLMKTVVIFMPLPILLHQPDFGTFTIYVMILFSLLFINGLRWSYIISAGLMSLPIFYFLVMDKPYRRARLMAFLDPWSDPAKSGFQVIQSMLSFSSGGVTGMGLGQGQGKLFFLPEAHTDFTLAVLGEETGFVGFLIIMLLYGFIVLRGFQIGARVEDKFAKNTALGLSVLFALQVLTNAGVVMGLLPTKGLTLPFLSYGGSSLVVLGMLFGILFNIDRSFLRSR
jgi:cell division protein FtsW